jgi:ACR3 family arsenite efflux pump ArsB
VETVLDISVGILHLIPLVLMFYIPALFGMAIWSECGEGYTIKAMLWFAIGFGTIVAVQILFSGASVVQAAGTVGLSLVEIAIALVLARLTVYRLAD